MTSLGTISVSEAMCLFQALTEEGFSYPVPDGRNENMFIMHNGDYEATVGITRSYTMCFVYNKRKDDERTRN